ncbi:helix-turn-helix domain-containing protein [Antarcticibacterium flavum]|uniref:Helix-turn-helix domain-containing protein n=1 Tax=Antarcticibacterium flavum TaxID=2058175 RepID=A0A5B7X0K1_9FLAO|nr:MULTISPECIES: helix-turn-helix domain-containing protein [Antarcticibacterium]MCM4161595.1 hypothetical protein [Antarcticibacterium sp. W02-3]QCY69036.1 helix-turn-helix domain-containing protein [Antarcticibacterium flavum]
MEREFNLKNMREIFRMIVEVAKGNFAYKIPRSNYRDLIEALSQRLNMMAEDLRENLNHLSYVNPHRNYQHIHNMCFLLDDAQNITGCSPNALKLLNREQEEIIGKAFDTILSRESMPVYNEIRQAINKNELSNSSFQLEYVTGDNLLVPAKCFVLRMVDEQGPTGEYTVSFFTTIVQKSDDTAIHQNGNSKKKMSNWDIKAIQSIHDYISHNFTNPLLSNKELAHMFDINEHKLTYGFKTLFGFTPFKYFTELRLQESKTLIRNTNNSLEDISESIGYTSYPHFSKAFKRRFGYSPIVLKRNPDHHGDDK